MNNLSVTTLFEKMFTNATIVDESVILNDLKTEEYFHIWFINNCEIADSQVNLFRLISSFVNFVDGTVKLNKFLNLLESKGVTIVNEMAINVVLYDEEGE